MRDSLSIGQAEMKAKLRTQNAADVARALAGDISQQFEDAFLLVAIDSGERDCETCQAKTIWHFSVLTKDPKWTCSTCKREEEFQPAFG